MPEGFRWHVGRSRRILADHPEVRSLIGASAWSALPIVGLVVFQFGMAAVAAELPLWGALLLAIGFGHIPSHALGVAIHETAHDLVFPKKWQNKLLAIVANMPIGVPGAMQFREEHLLHHRYLGARDGRDTQAPVDAELALTGRSTRGKLLWLLGGSLASHTEKPRRSPAERRWFWLNTLTTFGLWPPFLFWSVSAWAYLATSAFFAFGVTPLGIRRYSEHVALRPGQPTTSYYGPFNYVSFFVFHHVEHHDFPGIPWFRLPRLRRLARAHYDELASIPSLTGLLLRFLTDPEHGLFRYARMPSAGGAALDKDPTAH